MSSLSEVVLAVWIIAGQTAGQETPPLADREFENSIGMRLVLVPAGDFLMGSPGKEFSNRNGEQPQHRVRITKPYSSDDLGFRVAADVGGGG